LQTKHYVNGRNLHEGYPAGTETVYVGMGCFWGAERLFWEAGGVYVTAVGYGGGTTEAPTYHTICAGDTGHVELVKVVFAPDILPFTELLKLFFENHDPTQGNRQGNDYGTQYRSCIYTTTNAQLTAALMTKQTYNQAYVAAGKNPITTEIIAAPTFTIAEDGHQQYLAKNPAGYCNIGGTGVTCPLPS